jgi:hypothetical protein
LPNWFVIPASAISAEWLPLFGQGKGHGFSVGSVLSLGVVTPLTFQALPIRAGLHSGGRDDGLGRQDQRIWLILCSYKKATIELNKTLRG